MDTNPLWTESLQVDHLLRWNIFFRGLLFYFCAHFSRSLLSNRIFAWKKKKKKIILYFFDFVLLIFCTYFIFILIVKIIANFISEWICYHQRFDSPQALFPVINKKVLPKQKKNFSSVTLTKRYRCFLMKLKFGYQQLILVWKTIKLMKSKRNVFPKGDDFIFVGLDSWRFDR